MKRRILSFLLALVMVLSMLPLSMLSALEVTAEDAAETTVTLTVAPSNGSVHAVYDEETQKYTFEADLSISSNVAFPLGSLEFDLTPATGMTVGFTADTSVLTTLTVTDHAETAGAKVVSYLIAAGTAKADAYQLGTTPVKLGTLTVTSDAAFTFSGDVISEIASRQMVNEVAPEVDDGLSYTAVPTVISAYTKGDHDNAEATWTAVSDATGAAAMANGGHFYLAGDVALTGDITITGQTTTLCLNGQELSITKAVSMFNLKEGAQLTICDCTAHTDAEGNYIAGTIKHGQFKGGVAYLYADSAHPKFTMYDGIVTGEHLTDNGNYGGAVRVALATETTTDAVSTVTILGGEFRNCIAKQGAVICLNANTGATLTVDNVKFVGNRITEKKGAIMAEAGSTVAVTNSDFINQVSGGSGGAIFVSGTGTSLTIDNCNFEGNTVTEASANTYGGAVYFDVGSVLIKNSTFTNNTITTSGTYTSNGKTYNATAYGGALYVGSIGSTSSAKVENTTFTGNKAYGSAGNDAGGALYVMGKNKALELSNVDFSQNEAKHGGAIYATGAKLNITNDSNFMQNKAEKFAAAIFSTGSEITVQGSEIKNNTCAGDGASAIHMETSSKVRLEDCEVTGNTRSYMNSGAPTANGAIEVRAASSRLTFAGKMIVKDNTHTNGTDDTTDDLPQNLYFNTNFDTKDKNNALYVDGLTDDSQILVNTVDDRSSDANTLLIATANQTDWSVEWVTYENKPDGVIRMNKDVKTFELVSHAHDDDENGAVWEKWGDEADELTSLPDQTGNYLLVADINPTQEVKMESAENIKICLDGHTITAPADGRMYWMRMNAQIKFCDCDWDDDDVTGKLIPGTGKQLTSGSGGGIAYLQVGSESAQITEIKLTIENITIDGTGVETAYQGAAIWMGYTKCTTVLKNCTIKNCTSTNADSGAIYASSGSDLIAENVRFENNRGTGASSKAGAIRINSQTPVVDLTNCVFYGNSATAGSGAFYVTTGNVTMTGGSLENNTGAATGGAIGIYGGTVTLDGVTVKNNSLSKADAHLYGGAIYANAGTLTIQNGCTFESNTVTASGTYDTGEVDADENPIYADYTSQGGALYVSTNAALSISDSTFKSNTATGNGGALHVLVDGVTITGSTFTGNSTSVIGSTQYPNYAGGGALFVGEAGDVTLDGCTFSENTSATSGGAVYVYKGDLTVQNKTTFTQNSTTGKCGGALFSDQGTLELANTTFTGNTSKTEGGAVYVSGGTMSAEYTTFNSNTATTHGGAVRSYNGTIDSLDYCTFTDNTATSYGGAIYLSGTVKVNHSTFTGNTGTRGGALYPMSNATLTVTESDFSGNSASAYGGVVFSTKGKPTFTNCSFTGNECTSNSASVLYGEDNSVIVFDDCTITGNTHATTGSAVWLQGTTSTLTVAGATVIDDNMGTDLSERNVWINSEYDTGEKNLLRVKNLEEGARISVGTLVKGVDAGGTGADRTAPQLIKAADSYTPTEATWNKNWIRYDNNGQQVGYSDTAKAFVFVDNSTHSHTNDGSATWQAWTSVTTLPTGEGHYFLTKDVVVSDATYHSSSVDTVLCLNGHNVRSSNAERKIYEIGMGTVTVCDCTAYTDKEGNYHAGTIVTSTNTNGGAVGVFSKEAGTAFILKSGVIDGLGRTHTGTSAAVRVSQGNPAAAGLFRMEGGEIRNCVNDTENNTIIGLPTNGNFVMTGGKIHSNTSVNGGAITLANTNGGITIEGGIITNNTATGAGGAIYSVTSGAKISISNATISNNTAGTTGGAIHVKNVSPTITNTQITGNTSGTSGGAIYAEGGTTSITGGAVSGNHAVSNGGAIYAKLSATLNITNTQIKNNTAEDTGIVFVDGSTATLTGVTMTGNSATKATGGLRVENKGTATLDGCTIQNNTGNKGGGVHLRNNGSTLNIKGNTVITDNTTPEGVEQNVYLNYHETTPWGIIQMSEMAATAKIGVTLGKTASNAYTIVVFDKNTGPVQLASADNSYKKGMLFIDDTENDALAMNNDFDNDANDKYIMYAVAKDSDGQVYDSIANAQIGAGTKVISLRTDVAEDVTVNDATYLDLNGYVLTGDVDGTNTLYLIDSQTNDYTVEDGNYGKITGNTTGVDISKWHKIGGRYYAVVTEEDGSISAHRVYAAVTAKALRPNSTGIGFQARFAADEVIQELVTGFGMNLTVQDGNGGSSDVDLDAKKAGKTLNSEGTPSYVFAIKDFLLNTDTVINAVEEKDQQALINENKARANYTIVGTPFIKLSDTEIYTGTERSVTFMDMVTTADTNFAGYNETQQTALNNMYTTFSKTMRTWELNNIGK